MAERVSAIDPTNGRGIGTSPYPADPGRARRPLDVQAHGAHQRQGVRALHDAGAKPVVEPQLAVL